MYEEALVGLAQGLAGPRLGLLQGQLLLPQRGQALLPAAPPQTPLLLQEGAQALLVPAGGGGTGR